MKKSLKFLGLTILPLATLTSSLVVSGACDKKNKPEPKPQQDENNKDKNNEKLEKALEELEKIAKKLEFKIKTSDYFIKDALDIKKYTYTLKSGYELILKSIEKTNQDEVTIKYSVKDLINKLESKIYEQKFNGFKKENNQNNEQENKAKLEKAKKELEKIAKDLNLNIETSKYFIDQALEINKYTYNLSSNYELILKSIKKQNKDKISIQYSVKDKLNNLESKIYEQKFNGFKKESPTTDEFDINKHSAQLIDLFRLDKNKYASQNKNLFNVNDKKDTNFNLTDIKVNSYNDLDGTTNISVKGTFNNKNFSVDSLTISDRFKKPPLSYLITQASPKLNISKMIDEIKSIEDLEKMSTEELLKYFEELNINDKNHNPINLIDFVKQNPEYKITQLKIEKNGNKNTVVVKMELSLKMFANDTETDIKKDIVDASKQVIEKTGYDEKEILNYLLKNKLKFENDVSNNKDHKNTYASENKYYFEKSKDEKDSILRFSNFENHDKYLKLLKVAHFIPEIISNGYNDITGEIFATLRLGMQKNNQTYYSDPINITIKGFKKLDQNYFQNKFLIAEKNPADSKWNTIKQELKQAYNESNDKENFEINDPEKLKKYFQSQSLTWNILRSGASLNDDHIFQESKIWSLIYLPTGQDFIQTGFEKEKGLTKVESYWLNGIGIKFTKINKFKMYNGKLICEFVFELSFNVNSNKQAGTNEETTLTTTRTISMVLG
ncbi:hypothetical protein ACJA27_02565 [Mycoplasmopsis lipophila]|uniref:hypothetical protein n=1 Tax=Mycoplasmopsis lipophila TaxID=2117 RepID=UPI003873B900